MFLLIPEMFRMPQRMPQRLKYPKFDSRMLRRMLRDRYEDATKGGATEEEQPETE